MTYVELFASNLSAVKLIEEVKPHESVEDQSKYDALVGWISDLNIESCWIIGTMRRFL